MLTSQYSNNISTGCHYISNSPMYSFTSKQVMLIKGMTECVKTFGFNTMMFTSYTGPHDYLCITLVCCAMLFSKSHKYIFLERPCGCISGKTSSSIVYAKTVGASPTFLGAITTCGVDTGSNVRFRTGCLPVITERQSVTCDVCSTAGFEVYFWGVAQWPHRQR